MPADPPEKAEPPLVATIGHSNRSLEAFLALLCSAELELVVDVRRYPVSRRHPHFAKASLELALPRAGIGYVHLEDLGGHREERPGSRHLGLPSGPFRGYADHMGTPEFARALAQLFALSKGRRTAAMCAEARVEDCHRRLLADALLTAGARVVHLSERAPAAEHTLHPAARIVEGRLVYSGTAQGGLFD